MLAVAGHFTRVSPRWRARRNLAQSLWDLALHSIEQKVNVCQYLNQYDQFDDSEARIMPQLNENRPFSM